MKPRSLAAFALLLLMAPTTHPRPPADIQSRLDDWTTHGAGGVAAAWVDADGTAYFQAGTLDGPGTPAVTPKTEFEIGSITKVFTSLLLAESERLGKVSRNDPAAKYLLPADDPDQARLAGITLLSLATHTSGLPRLPMNIGAKPDQNLDPYAVYDRAMLIAALRAHGVRATPGRSVTYSNFGAAVLGEALASAWGTSYADALNEHVLRPLGMNSTTLGLAGTPAPANLAPAHAAGRRVPNWTQLAFAPAGALRSSAEDMAKFLSACLGYAQTPLQTAIAAALQPERPFEDVGGHIGLAWLLTDDPNVPLAWHNGATGGSRAFIGFSRKTGCGVVLLANSQRGLDELGFKLLGADPPKPTRYPVPNAADYVGSFPLTPSFILTITTEEGSLFVQATAQPRLALRPLSPDRFAIVGVPAEISFERGADGKVTALILDQNGIKQRAQLGPPPALPAVVTLPPDVLREYPGQYPLTPDFILTVTREDNALFVQATGQGKFPVYPSAKDEFFYQIVSAQISFQRGSDGKVNGLILHQNGRDLPGQKQN